MLAAMEQTPESNRDLVEDFMTTGRTGRRNAMADILGEHSKTGSGDLSEQMERLSTDQPGAPGTSGAGSAPKAAPAATPAAGQDQGGGSGAGAGAAAEGGR